MPTNTSRLALAEDRAGGRADEISCIEITTEAGLRSMEGPWRALFADSAYPTPFASWDWAWEWWRHFGTCSGDGRTAGRLLVVAAYAHAGHLIGLAPFYYDSYRRSPLEAKRLINIGERLAGDGMTEEPILVLRRGEEEQAIAAILGYLRKTPTRAAWDYFTLRLLRPPADGPETRSAEPPGLQAAVHRASVAGECYRITLPDSWEQFRRGLSKSMRDNLAYYPHRLTRHGYAWTVHRATAPSEVAAAVEVLIRLHRQRAQSPRGVKHKDYLSTETHRRFLEAGLSRLAARGMASVAVLDIDGQPAAAQAFLENAGTLTFYYSGFDPAWYDYSPLTILQAQVIREAIQRKVPRINMLLWPAVWKERWGAVPDSRMQYLTYSSPLPLSLLRMAFWKAGQRREKPAPEESDSAAH